MNINEQIQICDTEFDFTFARSGGPGGQNVNKVNSKAILRWNPQASAGLPDGVRNRFLKHYANRLTKDGDLVLHCQKYRDQGRNVAEAMERLRRMILVVVNPPVKRRPSRPTRGAVRRRLEQKKRTSEKKQNRRRPPND